MFGQNKMCKNCKGYSPILEKVGYCTDMRMIKNGSMLILDHKKILDQLDWDTQVIEYQHVVVTDDFGCIYFRK